MRPSLLKPLRFYTSQVRENPGGGVLCARLRSDGSHADLRHFCALFFWRISLSQRTWNDIRSEWS